MSGPPTRRVSASSSALILAIALLIAVGAAAAVKAQEGPAAETSRQSATLKLTSERADRPSGLRVRINYVNPSDPAAKPPAVRRVVEKLPRGARFDTSAPEQCPASNAELMLLGAGVCPAGSIIGSGEISLDTGLPAPLRMLETEVTFINNADELVFVTALQPLGARVVVRAEVEEDRFISEAPFLPGALPDGTAIDTVRARLDRVVTERGSYVTTPSRCARRGTWRSHLSFSYADGVTQELVSDTRCKRRHTDSRSKRELPER